MTPLIIQFLIFWIYVIFVWISNKKVLPSISDSWYYFPKKHQKLFMVFILGIAVPMFFQETGLFFFSGAFLCFTGAAPEFKDSKMTNTVHGVGAVGGIGFAAVALLVDGIWFPIAIGALISVALRYAKIKNETWWGEIIWFMLLWAGLVVRCLDNVPEPTIERILGVA